MKRIYHLSLSILLPFCLFAQQPRIPAIGKIQGRVLEQTTNLAVPYASVVVLAMGKDSVIAGALTADNGDFQVENLPFGNFRIRFQAIGLVSQVKNVVVSAQNIEQDMGDVLLMRDEKVLKTVEITGQKNNLDLGIDRKVFYVEKNSVSSGGTALDVMKTVPSVTLDADGNALLRNNAVTIYIDGRPTGLTLQQIPADDIEKIEIITNPSAKFEAGATSGILNIVLKKNKKPGYNGIVIAGIGTGNRYNSTITLNVKEKKYALGFTYSLNHVLNPGLKGYTDREMFFNGQYTGAFHQSALTQFGNAFNNGRLSADLFLNNRNTLTLAVNGMTGYFRNDEDQQYASSGPKNQLVYSGNRNNSGRNFMNNGQFQLLWKRTFGKPGKELTLDANANYTAANNRSQFTTLRYEPDGSLSFPFALIQFNKGFNKSLMSVSQLDFTNPINDSTKWETGARLMYRETHTGIGVNMQNPSNGEVQEMALMSSDYRITEFISAAYINYQHRIHQFGYQGGLRFESSNYTANNGNAQFTYAYPSNASTLLKAIFPSVYFSYKPKLGIEFQANYSRKINRPNFMQMMPMIMMADGLNYRIGNPNLKPEFVNLAEFIFSRIWKKGNWLSSFYYKGLEQAITPFTYPQIGDTTGIMVTTFTNGNTSHNFGWDQTLKLNPVKNLDLSLNTNLFYTSISADYKGTSFVNRGFNWNGKVNAQYKLPKDINLQITGNYESPKILPQGKSIPVYFMDIGFSKEWFKTFSATLLVSDLFNTKRMGSQIVTDYMVQDLSRRRESRFIRLTLSYRFGKIDASLFRKKPVRLQNGGGDMDF